MEAIDRVTVVYDDQCQLCRRCRAWLARSAQIVPMSFVAASDAEGVHALGLDPTWLPVGDELIVVGHTGLDTPNPVWVGPDAFITCLWALADHRTLAARLQTPAMRPIAKRAFHALTLGRGSISALLPGVAPIDDADCGDGTCGPTVGQNEPA